MNSARVEQNATERIRVTALSAAGAFLTGLTDVLLEIRRKSDGQYFDFDDTTFKASGWTTRQGQMAELDAVNSAGTYYYDFDTDGLSDDEYFIRATSTTADNLPAEGELKVGGYVDNLDTPISTIETNIATIEADVTEIHQRLGFDAANPVTNNTDGGFSVAGITVDASEDDDGNITQTRRP